MARGTKKHDGFPFAGAKGAAPGGMDKTRGNLDKDASKKAHKGKKKHARGRKRA